jgi:hypothetical protein
MPLVHDYQHDPARDRSVKDRVIVSQVVGPESVPRTVAFSVATSSGDWIDSALDRSNGVTEIDVHAAPSPRRVQTTAWEVVLELWG